MMKRSARCNADAGSSDALARPGRGILRRQGHGYAGSSGSARCSNSPIARRSLMPSTFRSCSCMCRWSRINGYVHYRLLSGRRVTWRHSCWLLSAMDIALITASVVVDGGFDNFLFLPWLSRPCRFCRRLHLRSAESHLDHGHRLHICRS